MRLADRPLGNRLKYIPVEFIRPNPNQPRTQFGDEALRSLAASIRENGVLQPLAVRRDGGEWELIAGERRLRAAKLAGLRRVPCVEVEADAERSSLLALVENLQRKDLDFVEQAEGIRRLIAEYNLSQEEAAQGLGLSQSAVANKLRILRLEPEILDALRRAGCTERHARALLALGDAEARSEAARTVIEEGLTVAETEALVAEMREERPAPPSKGRRKLVLRDVRIFLNTIREAVKLMKSAGVDVSAEEQESGDGLTVTVRIPHAVRKERAAL